MTASNAPAAPSAPADRRVEPSMEEILASIRKIIADEDAPPLRPSIRPTPEPSATESKADDLRPAAVVTPITASMTIGARIPGQPPVFGLSRPAAPVGVAPVKPSSFDLPPTPEADPPSAITVDQPTSSSPTGAPTAGTAEPADEPVPSAAPEIGSESTALVSSATTDSVSSAFEALSASIALTSGDLIDRHVREMLRPLLRSWLDDNLPAIVEKLVRAEIERVARRGR